VNPPLPDWTDGEPRLVIERCGRCGRRWYFRRERCPSCGSPDVHRRTSSGTGLVAAVTVMHPASGSIGVCLLDLDDGVRVMARCEPGLAVGSVATVGIVAGLPHAVPPSGTGATE
jgi:uncharacterized OB-fold protein